MPAICQFISLFSLFGLDGPSLRVQPQRICWPQEIEMEEGRKRGRREEEFIAVEIPIVESLSSFLSKKERKRERRR